MSTQWGAIITVAAMIAITQTIYVRRGMARLARGQEFWCSNCGGFVGSHRCEP